MSETAFTRKVRDYIKDKGGGSIKLGASQFLAKGTPDLVCCLNGYTFFLEDKVWPNTPSLIQLGCIGKMRKEGFFAWVLTLKGEKVTLDEIEYNSLEEVFTYICSYIRNQHGGRL